MNRQKKTYADGIASISVFLVLAGCASSGDRIGGPVLVVPDKVRFADEIKVSTNVRLDCALENKVAKYVAREASDVYDQVQTSPQVTDKTPGTVLTLQITNVSGDYGTGWTGAGSAGGGKSLTVQGSLFVNGREHGSFIARRRTGVSGFAPYRRTCDMLDKDAKVIAADIAKWLRAPAMSSRLGDAK